MATRKSTAAKSAKGDQSTHELPEGATTEPSGTVNLSDTGPGDASAADPNPVLEKATEQGFLGVAPGKEHEHADLSKGTAGAPAK
jgi:hypothetical protein